MRDRNESLAGTIKDLMWAEPFWGLFLIGFHKQWSNIIPTACVSKNGLSYALTINEEFWENLEKDWRKGILQHEAIHIGYFHLHRAKEFDDEAREKGEDRNKAEELRQIAADLVVNQDCRPEWLPCKNITKEQFRAKYEPVMESLAKELKEGKISQEEARKELLKIPPRGVYLEDFKELKLEPKQGLRYYYDKLKQEADKGPGKCNKFLQSLLDNAMYGPEGPLGHKLWKEFEGLSEAEKKLLKTQLDYHLREVAEQVKKSRGTVPGNIAHYLEGLDEEEPAKFNWKAYLRRFVGGSRRTYTKKLRRKYNKRFEDNPGLRIKQRKHVMLAVDTSGSVSNDELREFFHEIDHIHRTGTEITVVQCDAAISDISTYRTGMKLKNKDKKITVKGRSGTDFNPPVDYYNENYKKFCAMIYFTDGECSPPENPVRGKLLWVLSSKSQDNPSLPGYRIKFEV